MMKDGLVGCKQAVVYGTLNLSLICVKTSKSHFLQHESSFKERGNLFPDPSLLPPISTLCDRTGSKRVVATRAFHWELQELCDLWTTDIKANWQHHRFSFSLTFSDNMKYYQIVKNSVFKISDLQTSLLPLLQYNQLCQLVMCYPMCFSYMKEEKNFSVCVCVCFLLVVIRWAQILQHVHLYS